MEGFTITLLLAGVVAGAAPILLATLGETLTERSGIINLSLDGTILLSAMTAFVVALKSGSILLGFMAGAGIGAFSAFIVALFSIKLELSQVAVGFVLTLMTRDLAYFLGSPYARIQGPQLIRQPIPLLRDIPYLGDILFNQSLPVYFSLVMIIATWWFLYRTPQGLRLRSVGENPDAAYARGIDPGRVQMISAVAGGLMVGLAGASFSLCIKPGWGQPQGAEGAGWIALALVIFGGWHPFKAAAGAYLFAFLQMMSIYFQGWTPQIPAQVFQVAPFPVMILILLVISWAQRESVQVMVNDRPVLKALIRMLSGAAPAALGKRHKVD